MALVSQPYSVDDEHWERWSIIWVPLLVELLWSLLRTAISSCAASSLLGLANYPVDFCFTVSIMTKQSCASPMIADRSKVSIWIHTGWNPSLEIYVRPAKKRSPRSHQNHWRGSLDTIYLLWVDVRLLCKTATSCQHKNNFIGWAVIMQISREFNLIYT